MAGFDMLADRSKAGFAFGYRPLRRNCYESD